MAAAKPKDFVRTGTGAAPATKPVATGLPGVAGNDPLVLSPALQDQLRNGTPVPNDGPYPGPNTTWPVRNLTQPYTDFPFDLVGVLLFTEPGVGDFRCSASVTTYGSALNWIWTAGHCVANGGRQQYYTNLVFCPGWNNGAPNPVFGCWGWRSATTTGQWFTNGAYTKDYAMVRLQTTGSVLAEKVATAVGGGFGFAWNLGRDQHWLHMGYPAQAPYDGTKMIVTATEHRYDEVPDSFGPPTNSWGSPQTEGSSGSPVILDWGYGNGTPGPGFINSTVSYSYPSQPNEMYGPYFDTAACQFWAANVGWPGTC